MTDVQKFEELKSLILQIAENKGCIPSYKDLKEGGVKNAPKTVQNLFLKISGEKYQDLCKRHGFKEKNTSSFARATFNDMCFLWEKWYKEHGYYPIAKDCRKRNYLPAYETLMKILGDRRYEFTSRFKMPLTPNIREYQRYEEAFIRESNKLGFPLRTDDLDLKGDYNHLIPSSKWMIRNCPDENVKCYNSLVEYMGFKPRYMISRELAVKKILQIYEQNGRVLQSDFVNHEHTQDIGITTVTNHWGTFNNMLKDLELPINWEKLRHKKTIEEVKKDILDVCESVRDSEGRIKISSMDIEQYEDCFSSMFYYHYFSEVIGITLREYIESIGYELFDVGKGFNFTYNDGEVALSQLEFRASNYFRSKGLVYNSDYRKDVDYQEFIEDYRGRRTIDYIIFDRYYIEIAGIQGRESYDKTIKEKEDMLKRSELEYLIVYPDDFIKYSLNEIFLFLEKGEIDACE